MDEVRGLLTPEHFRNGRVPSRTTVADRLAGVALAQDFVEAIADICSRDAADTDRLLAEARAARQRAKDADHRDPLAGSSLRTAELVLVQQRSIEVSDKLLRAQERMMQLERERNDANQMVLILLAMAEKLQRDIATLGRQRDRLDDAGPVREELRQVRERLTRSEEQRDTAESELKRARAERQKADELAEEAAARVRLLTMQLARLRGEAPDISDPDGLAVAVSESGEALASGDDIDVALSKATRHLDDRAERLDQLAEELHSDNFPDDFLTSHDEPDILPDNPPEPAHDDSSAGPVAAFLEIRDYVHGDGVGWDSNYEERPYGNVSSRATQPSPLGTITRDLRTNGVPLPGDLSRAMRQCVRPVKLDAISVDPAPDDLVKAWKATKSHRAKELREVVWIPLLHMFREHFSRPGPATDEALRAAGMHLMATRREVTVQLGSRYFHLGQRLFMDGQREPARFLLREAVRALEWVDRNGHRMPIARRCAWNGQLAIARVLLARELDEADPEALDLLRRAEDHSAFAEQDDKTEEHFAYRAEIHLRLFRAERTSTHLEKAHDILCGLRHPPTSRKLRTTRADVLAGLGLVRLRSGQLHEGLQLLRDAEAAYTEAQDTAGQSNSQDVHVGYLLAQRGHVRYQLYRFDVDAVGRRGNAWLEDALSDLLAPEATGHMSERVIAAALLDRSRVRQRRRDRAGSAADLDRARAMLGTSQESAHLTAQVRVRELDEG
ncbi:hypothetical protein [Streptomyces sp. NPDC048508]|uniref:hypothetical protein n=1 Tax=Streptomyces sp. NPDC048508 TaxID=3365561 RepID=UPI00371015F2